MTFYDRLEADTQQRNVAELYTLTKSGSMYYYTSFHEDVIHDGITYYSRVIQRKGIASQFDSMAMSCSITAPTDAAFSIFVDRIPVSDVTVSIVAKMLHTGEIQQVFAGKLKDYSIANYRCTASFQNRGAALLKESVPKMRYQGPCNNALFDSNCNLGVVQYKLGGEVVYTSDHRSDLDEREVVIQAGYNDGFGEDLDDKPDSYFIGGTAMYNGHYRDISGSGPYAGGYVKLRLQYAFPEGVIVAGTVLSIWPGCNKSIEHCVSRFNNLNHFAGFPYIPSVGGAGSNT